jgi:hypothetical protein
MLNLIITFLFFNLNVYSRNETPVHWTYSYERLNGNEVNVSFKANIKPGWHIYSKDVKNNALKTKISYNKSNIYQLKGKLAEPAPFIRYEQKYKLDVFYFENQVIFKQKFKLKSDVAQISGKVNYQICNYDSNRQLEEKFLINIK